MNQEKIGKFIAQRRKEKHMTQAQLASYLSITDRAVSKWERGKGLPDATYMLDLCKLLDISVNELLTGELIEKNDYHQKAEGNLLTMAKQEAKQTKKMLFYENVIGCITTLCFLLIIFITAYYVKNTIMSILLFIIAFIILITGVSIALKIETEEGYYECQKCHHKYIPTYKQVYFAMHFGRTRYMKCPQCKKRSWQKKIYSK